LSSSTFTFLVCSLFAYAVNFSFFSQSLLEHQKNPKKQLQKHFQNSMVFVFSNLIFCWRVLLSFLLLLYLFTDDQCHIQQKNICQHSICHRYLFWIITLKFELWKDYNFTSLTLSTTIAVNKVFARLFRGQEAHDLGI
jgi:hypothetical protein